jgi:hypothetical protein
MDCKETEERGQRGDGREAPGRHTERWPRPTGEGTEEDEPSEASKKWVRSREVQQHYHKFGNQRHQMPHWWPPSYFEEGWPVCPPKVKGEATQDFHADRKHVYTFHGRKYTYIGQQEGPKPHWEPFPCPPRPLKGKGKGKKGKGGKERQRVERKQDELCDRQGEPHGSRNWFPPLDEATGQERKSEETGQPVAGGATLQEDQSGGQSQA